MLDKVLAKHPRMVLLHGDTDRGAEKIAACWASARKVTQIAFRPHWDRDGKAAPFKRNDHMLDVLPIGLVVFPGSGITDNLADTRPASLAWPCSTTENPARKRRLAPGGTAQASPGVFLSSRCLLTLHRGCRFLHQLQKLRSKCPAALISLLKMPLLGFEHPTNR